MATETRPPDGPIPVALALAVPAVVLGLVALLRLHNGWGGIDLSIWDQALWRASEGHPGVTTILGESLLADHFSPAVLLFVPLYRLAASPVWLVLAQVIAAWAAVLIVVSRLRRSSWQTRALIGSALLLSPPVAFAVIGDPHANVLALPFALAAVFAIDDDRPWLACVLGLVAALFRLEVALAVLAAFAAFPRRTNRRWPAALVLLAYCGIAFHFEHALGRPGGQWETYYGYLGSSPVEALTHPYRVAAGLFTWSAFRTAAFWLACGGFIALWRPRWAIPAAAVGLPVLLSHWVGSHQWGLHYDIVPTMFLVAAGIPVLERQRQLPARLLLGIVIVSIVAGPGAPIRSVTPPTTSIQEIARPAQGLLCVTEGIPGAAGVSASAEALALLAHRDELFSWPSPFYDPASTGRAVYSMPARPDLAAKVDFIVKGTSDANAVPDGYVLDASAAGYQRFRKATLALAPERNCS